MHGCTPSSTAVYCCCCATGFHNGLGPCYIWMHKEQLVGCSVKAEVAVHAVAVAVAYSVFVFEGRTCKACRQPVCCSARRALRMRHACGQTSILQVNSAVCVQRLTSGRGWQCCCHACSTKPRGLSQRSVLQQHSLAKAATAVNAWRAQRDCGRIAATT